MPSAGTRVYVEVGRKRTFAGALDWPGWARSGRDEPAALEALIAYAPRYAEVLRGTRLGFRAPGDVGDVVVAERLEGDATTDFGAPGIPPAADRAPLDAEGLGRSHAILESCWRAFDAGVEGATGRQRRKGPRGGGRELAAIVRHVLEADGAYLAKLARKPVMRDGLDVHAELATTREAIVEALAAAVRGEIPERGPRGGVLWPPRYFVRRVAWHVLDHAWEIEDRTI